MPIDHRLLRTCATAAASGVEAPFDTTAAVFDAVAGLHPVARRVLVLRYGLDGQAPRTLAEVAAHFGVTRDRIRRIELDAVVS